MKWEDACKLSKVGIAIRNQGNTRSSVSTTRWTYDDAHCEKPDKAVRPPGAGLMPSAYAGVFPDWEPYKPRDAISMLGDIVRDDGPPPVFGPSYPYGGPPARFVAA